MRQYLISAITDSGNVRENNEDRVKVWKFDTPVGPVVLAVLCDGMGGLSQGEVASQMTIQAFEQWGKTQLMQLCAGPFEDYEIRESWETLAEQCNRSIRAYGMGQGVKLGTTVVALLLTPRRYYLLNVGDSRAYEVSATGIRQLTEDQSLVNSEIKSGRLTREQAAVDTRRNVLLQCIGVKEEVIPDLYFGNPEVNTVYLLCSDGFYHEVRPEEMTSFLSPASLSTSEEMAEESRYLIELAKQRGEKDNITVAAIKINP
jgi:serine/threonine protein phosphatase PrpC